jgi:hypothetical protein
MWMKKMFNEGNQIHNLISSSGSGTVINYGSGSGSDILTSYGSGYGSGSTSQKVTVPTVPVPVPQHWFFVTGSEWDLDYNWYFLTRNGKMKKFSAEKSWISSLSLEGWRLMLFL